MELAHETSYFLRDVNLRKESIVGRTHRIRQACDIAGWEEYTPRISTGFLLAGFRYHQYGV